VQVNKDIFDETFALKTEKTICLISEVYVFLYRKGLKPESFLLTFS
jgi:hypothetical protein